MVKVGVVVGVGVVLIPCFYDSLEEQNTMVSLHSFSSSRGIILDCDGASLFC